MSLSQSQNIIYPGSIAFKVSPWIIAALNKQHPDLVPIYFEFYQEYLSGGFYELCMDVDRFKQEVEDENQMRINAMQIYDKYWSAVTQYDVVIREKLREQMAQQIDTWTITSDIFDATIRKLEEECFKKFNICEKFASFMADRGTYVRTASPRRRLSITDTFIKKGAAGRRSSLASVWSPKNSAEIMDLDDGYIAEENGLAAVSEECC